MRRILSLLVVLCVLVLGGCASQKRSDSLTTTLAAYGSTLRWGDFQTALQFIQPKVLKKHPLSDIDLARYKQVRVTDYNDDAGPAPIDDFDVEQNVRISIVNVHTQEERTITDHQTWHFDQKTQHWWLTSGLPDITQR